MMAHTSCRVCGSSVEPILSLGEQYVSTFLNPDESDGIKAPLELILCSNCKLLQLKHTVPGEKMFKNYWYVSGTNQTMKDALSDVACRAEQFIDLKEGDTVLDIGCNDGTLLASYNTPNIYKIGFDPAENLATASRKVTDKVVVDYFDAKKFFDLAEEHPKIVTSIAMFYALDDPNKFVSDVKCVMHPDGVWIIQLSYLPLMLKQNDFGNICHEHLEYYSLQSIEYLLSLHGLDVVNAELNDVNGGSIRIYVKHKSEDLHYTKTLLELREAEKRLKLDTVEPYKEFAARVNRIKNDVYWFVQERLALGETVYVYGASTKGNTMLQYFGLTNLSITAAAERNPDKWGKVTVGSRIPIISEDKARAANPNYFLVLPWHFIEEFISREKEYLHNGRFIVPCPNFTLI